MLGFGLLRKQGLPGLSMRQGAWSPASLFRAGEQGGWYDPSDLTTLFQDSFGTTPVTASGQPVGLALDKRLWGDKTLAQVLAGQPELKPAAFDFLGTGWSYAGGILTATAGSNGQSSYENYTTGEAYACELNITVTSGTLQIYAGGALVKSVTSSSTVSIKAVFAASPRLQFTSASFVGTISIVSIKKVPGNHDSQATTASRPTYKNAPSPASMATQPELVVNGDFSSASGWSGSGSVSGGVATIIDAQIVYQDRLFEAGKTYEVEWSVSRASSTGNGLRFQALNGDTPYNGEYLTGVGKRTERFIGGNNTRFRIAGSIGANADVDYITIKEIPAGAPYIHWLEDDGVDDILVGPSITLSPSAYICAGLKTLGDGPGAGAASALGLLALTNRFTTAVRSQSGVHVLYSQRRVLGGPLRSVSSTNNVISKALAYVVESVSSATQSVLKVLQGATIDTNTTVEAQPDDITEKISIFSGAASGFKTAFFGGVILNREPTEYERNQLVAYFSRKAGL